MHILWYHSKFPATMPPQIAASLANLLWLMALPPGERAGCTGLTESPLAAALALHFPGLRTDPPFGAGSLDFYAGLSGAPLSKAALDEAARSLTTGGLGMLVGTASRRWAETRRLRRAACQAGFTTLRVYRVAGSLERPFAVVPDSTAALVAHERAPARHGLAGFLRRQAIRAGGVSREFTGLVLVGTRA